MVLSGYRVPAGVSIYFRPCSTKSTRIMQHKYTHLRLSFVFNEYTQTQVIMPLTVTGSLNEFYQEPEKFMPERWSRDNKDTPNVFSSLPFGYGPRMCVGKKNNETACMGRFNFVIPNNYESILCTILQDAVLRSWSCILHWPNWLGDSNLNIERKFPCIMSREFSWCPRGN